MKKATFALKGAKEDAKALSVKVDPSATWQDLKQTAANHFQLQLATMSVYDADGDAVINVDLPRLPDKAAFTVSGVPSGLTLRVGNSLIIIGSAVSRDSQALDCTIVIVPGVRCDFVCAPPYSYVSFAFERLILCADCRGSICCSPLVS